MEQCYGCKSLAERIEQTERALDAEREKVAKLEKIQAIDLKNNNEYREQLATLQAQLRQVEQANARLREALDKLARLGNEPYYGNSTGNVIAQQALADTDLQTNDQQKGA